MVTYITEVNKWRPGDFGLYKDQLYKVLDINHNPKFPPNLIRIVPMPTIPIQIDKIEIIDSSKFLPFTKEQQLVYKICGDLPKNRRTKPPISK